MRDFVVWTNAHNVRIEVPLASIGMRILAHILDSVIRISFILLIIFVVTKLFDVDPGPWTMIILVSPLSLLQSVIRTIKRRSKSG